MVRMSLGYSCQAPAGVILHPGVGKSKCYEVLNPAMACGDAASTGQASYGGLDEPCGQM